MEPNLVTNITGPDSNRMEEVVKKKAKSNTGKGNILVRAYDCLRCWVTIRLFYPTTTCIIEQPLFKL